ncbi:phosphotransferase [Microlunatus speluncae]|uniref:phosphotransferase n=1 Tax=Microlunatus speluncae TaxID=2594267 RepID=UPI0012663FA6|nr:phosphotransferase [Microlunatus speluncae]
MTRWSTSLTATAVAELLAVVRRRKPEIVEAPAELIGEGISTLTYGLSSSSGEWVLRVSRQHPEPWTWRGGRGHEVELLAELRRRGLPVPAEAEVIEQVDGRPAAILERRVIGAPLSADQVRDDHELTMTIAAILDRLHGFEVDDAIRRGVPQDDPVAEFRQALDVVDLADDGLRRRVESAIIVLERRARLRVLCHRDFRVDHLIIGADGGLAGLLDLGEVGIDDPAVDLAFLHGELGAEKVAEICAAMKTADAGLAEAARVVYSLWPLLELAPGGETWGDPATARGRLEALV